MKTQTPTILLFCLIISSCQFNKSVNKDLMTGLTTMGDGLSCGNVYLSNGEEEIARNTFVYGEKFYLNFDDIKGFNKIDDYVFPGLGLYVVNQAGDTVFKNIDLYANKLNGVKISPLLLNTNLTVAKPMGSKEDYTLYINIWDKKGEGTFKATLDFNVVPNDEIKIKSNNIVYKEIYLFSKERGISVTDNVIEFKENIYMIFEGLDGFKQENGKVNIGLSMHATDDSGELILNEVDLVGDNEIEIASIKTQLAPSFMVPLGEVKNPINCKILVWDKKSDSRIEVTTKLNIE